ncbi:hypothetical protein [Williamsia maris]|uniref:Hydroxylaminobenzene mutase n=1 Tax=Williamsia maris TaxID=72806 RepID=A0ABT1HEI2_9NOCA|nr:hypothetical protein [Williamsia maris]MCP2176661.1 hypothetical protein [Williamsia maris]
MTDVLILVGLWSIAVGAVSGFAVTLVVEKPDALRAIGLIHQRRVFQTHLDWIIMGILMVAVGAVASDTPDWALVLVVIGGIVNPLLFIPLGFNADIQKMIVYKAISGLSFVSLSTGLVVTAIAQTVAY